MTDRASAVVGEDGLTRCAWVGNDPEYRRYHDEEWGRPLHGDQRVFEKIALEGFQAGLSWITILRRRAGFGRRSSVRRRASCRHGPHDVEALMLDARIIRNREDRGHDLQRRVTLEMNEGELDELVWSFAPPAGRRRPNSLGDIPAVTTESTALSKTLRSRGFRFVGPTTMYALMQSAGLVDDHVVGCHRAD